MNKALFKPLRYLMIKVDAKGKKTVDFKYPTITSLFISFTLVGFEYYKGVNVFLNDNSILANIINLIATLPGFYIAALAAISTFPSESMKSLMPEPTPYLGDPSDRDQLSRRRFLSYMFAYLAYISIMVYLFSSIVSFLYNNIDYKVNYLVFSTIYFSCNFIIFFFLAQIVLLTLVGLWYLGERIHFNDPDDPPDVNKLVKEK